MKFTKIIVLALVLVLFVSAFVACGGDSETESEFTTETEAPATETNAPETDPPESESECVHDVLVEEAAPTCESRGYYSETCKICGELLVVTAYPKIDCTPSGPATCDVDSTCIFCGKVLEAAKGHTFVGEPVIVYATCLSDGSKTQKCSTCGESVVEKTQAFAHRIPAENVTNSVAPTCSTDGSVTGTCTLCNKVQTVAIPAAHTFGADGFAFENLSFDEEGNVTAKCSVCGQSAVTAATETFSLTFDEFKPDHVWNTGADASVRNGRLYLPANPCAIYTFDASLLEDSDVYMISFDYRRTSTNTEASGVHGLFGLATVKADGTAADGHNYGLKIQRGTFKYAAGGTGNVADAAQNTIGETIATDDASALDKIVIVVDNTNGNSYVYINGVFHFYNQNDNFLVNSERLGNGQTFAWRFGGQYNLNISPEYDNFTVAVFNANHAESEECKHLSSSRLVVTPATCAAAGTANTVCDRCGVVLETEDIPMLKHEAGTVTDADYAECAYEATCKNCGEACLFAKEDATHTVKVDAVSFDSYAIDGEGNVMVPCSVCGQNAVVPSNEKFALTFDTFEPDYVWNSGTPAYVRNGRLYLPANPCPIYTFDASLLENSDTYVISFDYRRTSTNTEASGVHGIFGLATVNSDGTAASEYNFALKIQRGTFRYAAGGTGNNENAGSPANVISDTVAAGSDLYDKIVIVVDNTNGSSYVYINGVFHFYNNNANFLVDSEKLGDGQSFAWRFGGHYNLNICPEYDNFKVYTLGTVTE